MGREQEDRIWGDVLDPVDERHALGGESFHHVPVVDDLVVDVDPGSENADRLVKALDRHVHARTESAGIGQGDLHG